MRSLLASDKEFADCQAERRAYDAGGGAGRESGGRGSAAAQAACTGWARLKTGGQGTRGAHIKHVAHGCDAGRVEAQRLVERRRALPSQKKGMRCGGSGCGPGGERACGGGGASGMHGGGPD
eukprot:scaffold44213_cov50-Phaeocystis_antarctica.AAC.3